jgi:hypothetical protein
MGENVPKVEVPLNYKQPQLLFNYHNFVVWNFLNDGENIEACNIFTAKHVAGDHFLK